MVVVAVVGANEGVGKVIQRGMGKVMVRGRWCYGVEVVVVRF